MKNILDLAKLQPGANKHKRHSKLQNPVIKNGKNPVIKNGKNAVLQKICTYTTLLDPRFLKLVLLTAKFQQARISLNAYMVIKVHSKINPSVFVRSFHRCSTKSFTSLRTESFAHNGVKVILNPHLNFHPLQ